MNKKIIKKILMALGVILLVVSYFIYCKDTDLITALILMITNIFDDFGKIGSTLTILGLILLMIGIFMSNNDVNNKTIKFYKRLIIIGIIPFVGIICAGFYSAFAGFSFMFDITYGFEGFYESILIYSVIFAWPLEVAGLIMIIKGIIEIKRIKK